MTDGPSEQPSVYQGPERRRAPLPTSAEIEGWRKDTRELTGVTRELVDRLDDLATRGDLETVERDVATYISGAKAQLRRTRQATLIMVACALLFLTAVSLQLHELQLRECIIQPVLSDGQRFWCDASMPLSSHHGTMQPPADSAVARAFGLSIYAVLVAGFGLGLGLYRRRRHEEVQPPDRRSDGEST